MSSVSCRLSTYLCLMSAVTLSLRTLYSAVLGVEQGVTNVFLITAISYIVIGRTHFTRTAQSVFNSVQIRSDLFTFQAKFAGNYYSYMHTRIQSAYTWFGRFLIRLSLDKARSRVLAFVYDFTVSGLSSLVVTPTSCPPSLPTHSSSSAVVPPSKSPALA